MRDMTRDTLIEIVTQRENASIIGGLKILGT